MDQFTSTFGAERGHPAGLARHDEDVIGALLAGELMRGERFMLVSYPDGPDPSAVFLVDRTRCSGDDLRGHGIIAARWLDSDGTLNIACACEFPDEFYAPIGQRCAQDGARSLMSEMVALGADREWAAGRIAGEKVDRSVATLKRRWRADDGPWRKASS